MRAYRQERNCALKARRSRTSAKTRPHNALTRTHGSVGKNQSCLNSIKCFCAASLEEFLFEKKVQQKDEENRLPCNCVVTGVWAFYVLCFSCVHVNVCFTQLERPAVT